MNATSFSLSLDGEWRLDFFPQPATGLVRALPLSVPHETVPATVPGNCELDLARTGLLPPPEIGLNALAWRRYEGHQWLYSRTFPAPDIPAGGHAFLVFEGIDTLADIFLNGEKIGEAANMLVPHRFDVTSRLHPGENTVQVLLRSAFLEAKAYDAAMHSFQDGTADRAFIRKAAHMGGWDIFPRLFVSGLWRSVSHCNLLRVWGGGVYEPDSFYDWCDEHGILVWQDFMTGCAQTPQNDAYAAATGAETRSVVLRLRNHPCLALWGLRIGLPDNGRPQGRADRLRQEHVRRHTASPRRRHRCFDGIPASHLHARRCRPAAGLRRQRLFGRIVPCQSARAS